MESDLEMSRLLNNGEKETDETDSIQDNPLTSRTEIAKGLASAFGFVIVLVATATWVALLDKSIGDFELFSLRSTFAVVMCMVLLIYRKKLPIIPRRDVMNISFYSIVGNGVSLTYIAVTLIPASSVQCVAITSSIVSGVILYWVFLKEKVTLKNVLCAFICSTGVVLIVQPDFFFQNFSRKNSVRYQRSNGI